MAVDFIELSSRIIANDGAKDYDEPLAGFSGQSLSHPGQTTYGNGPSRMSLGDLSQEQIDAQHKSIRDAISLYMPMRDLATHMCNFYRGDFLKSDAYKKASKYKIRIPTSFSPYRLDNDELSFQFNNPAHKSKTRQYFTGRELEVVEKVGIKRPEISNTVLAFQAGFIDYLQHLSDAFKQNDKLAEFDRFRAREIVEMLAGSYDTPNFSTDINPCICLAYHERDPELKSPVEEKDFARGFEIAMQLGVFRHSVVAHNGDRQERRFTCPAHMVIGGAMARDAEHIDKPANIGAMMGMILDATRSKGDLAAGAKPAACPASKGS